jgi:hypothetical protein
LEENPVNIGRFPNSQKIRRNLLIIREKVKTGNYKTTIDGNNSLHESRVEKNVE